MNVWDLIWFSRLLVTSVACKMVTILAISILNEVSQTDKYDMISLKRISIVIVICITESLGCTLETKTTL